MRDEWPRRGASVQRLHHGRFHFQIPVRFELPAQRGDDLRAGDEDLLHIRVGNQIQIALAIADLHILQPVPFLRHAEQRLGEEIQVLGVYAELAGSRTEEIPFHSDNVAEVEQLPQREVALAHRVLLHINLGPLAALLEMRKPGFTHAAHGLNAARNAHRGALLELFRRLRAPVPKHLRNGVGEIEALAVGMKAERLYLRDALVALSE